jgi:hypothetical protein
VTEDATPGEGLRTGPSEECPACETRGDECPLHGPEKPEGWMSDEDFEACVQKEVEYRRLRKLNTAKSFLAGDADRMSHLLRVLEEILVRQPSLVTALFQGGATQLLVVSEEARKEGNSARDQMDRLDREIDEIASDFSAYQRIKKAGRERLREDNSTE